MASATINTQHVTKLIPVETEVKTVETVTLALTLEEAEVLRTLLGMHVKGSGPVKDITDDIWMAFVVSGVKSRPGLFTESVYCAGKA